MYAYQGTQEGCTDKPLIASQAGNDGLKSPPLLSAGAGGVPVGDPIALAPRFPAQLPSAACPGACVALS